MWFGHMEVYEIKSTTSSLFGSKSKVKAKGGGRLQAVKSVTVPGKCSAISDGDWTVFPFHLLILHRNSVYDVVHLHM